MSRDEDIDKFGRELEDRFGKMPEPTINLLEVVKIRNRAQSLGIEKVIVKQGVAALHFVSDKESAFYQSPIFGGIIGWIQANPRKVQMKQVNDKLYMTIKAIGTISELSQMVNDLQEFVKEKMEDGAGN